jgi:hypothetical protein
MLGPALGGFFIGKSIEQFKLNDRVVVVKGLSEKEVKSDLAVWIISYKNSENDFTILDKKMVADKAAIENFLLNSGFSKDDVTVGSVEMIDKAAREYGSDDYTKGYRYIMTGKIILRTNNVDLVAQAQEKISQLISQDVVISGLPAFYYTKLLEVRPEMIAEATKNARMSAKQFADDSGCKVGSIRSANQGVFSILARDSFMSDSYGADSSSLDKKVRVVTTITFSLEK